LDDMPEITEFMKKLRLKVKFEELEPPTVIIYTGYELDDIKDEMYWTGLSYELQAYGNCILKYGPYEPVYDDEGKKIHIWNEDLGVYLASPNQGTITYKQKKET